MEECFGEKAKLQEIRAIISLLTKLAIRPRASCFRCLISGSRGRCKTWTRPICHWINSIFHNHLFFQGLIVSRASLRDQVFIHNLREKGNPKRDSNAKKKKKKKKHQNPPLSSSKVAPGVTAAFSNGHLDKLPRLHHPHPLLHLHHCQLFCKLYLSRKHVNSCCFKTLRSQSVDRSLGGWFPW